MKLNNWTLPLPFALFHHRIKKISPVFYLIFIFSESKCTYYANYYEVFIGHFLNCHFFYILIDNFTECLDSKFQ